MSELYLSKKKVSPRGDHDSKQKKKQLLRLVPGRPELRRRGGLDGLLRGGAAAVAAHD